MVEQTALQILVNFISQSKLKEMMKWSDRKLHLKDGKLLRYTRVLKKKIRQVLNLVSGNDIIQMLKGDKFYVFLQLIIFTVSKL
jgi:hypothetical protein